MAHTAGSINRNTYEATTQDDVSEVLTRYIELFGQNSYQFKYYLAPNSVIDWYGRTVRGANKIHDYMRHEVNAQYEHVDFQVAEACACAPIETKTSHLRTRTLISSPIDHIHRTNRVPDMLSLKSYAESDIEDEDNEVMKTPEKNVNTFSTEDLTPPESITKLNTTATTESDEEDDGQSLAIKRLKRTHSGRFTYLRRLPTGPTTTTCTKRKDAKRNVVRTLNDSSSEEEEESQTLDSSYTPLCYLEVKGVMRERSSLQQTQRSGIWGDSNERATRLRISYRRRLTDQQLQFALIIYEALDESARSVSSRRNLMSQLNLAADDDDEEMIIEAIETTTADSLASNVETQMTNIPSAENPSTDYSIHLRTPTKHSHTPPATPKRKSRSAGQSTSGSKHANISPSTPTPKRSAARSLRL